MRSLKNLRSQIIINVRAKNVIVDRIFFAVNFGRKIMDFWGRSEQSLTLMISFSLTCGPLEYSRGSRSLLNVLTA